MVAPKLCEVRSKSIQMDIRLLPDTATKLSTRIILDDVTKLVKSVTAYVPARPYDWETLDPYALRPDYLVSQGLPLGDFISLRQSGLDVCGNVDAALKAILDSSSVIGLKSND